MKPTRRDFDAAVKQPWSGSTCIIAHCIMREGFNVHDATAWSEILASSANESIMAEFDRGFKHPGDETKPVLVALRESLPE